MKTTLKSICYIVENFPDLWMIENNTTYRGFIFDSKNPDQYNAGFFDTYVKESGHLGRDFAAYYKGNYIVGENWWTDSYLPADYWNNCAGARWQYDNRAASMADWGQRWLWLRQ